MAARDAPHREPPPAQGAVPLDGLEPVRRARWIIATRGGQEGREEELVAPDECDEQPRRGAPDAVQHRARRRARVDRVPRCAHRGPAPPAGPASLAGRAAAGLGRLARRSRSPPRSSCARSASKEAAYASGKARITRSIAGCAPPSRACASERSPPPADAAEGKRVPGARGARSGFASLPVSRPADRPPASAGGCAESETTQAAQAPAYLLGS